MACFIIVFSLQFYFTPKQNPTQALCLHRVIKRRLSDKGKYPNFSAELILGLNKAKNEKPVILFANLMVPARSKDKV
jgi:hypothetical protein